MDIRSNTPIAANTPVNRNRRRWTLVGGVVAAACLTFAIGAVVAISTSDRENQSPDAPAEQAQPLPDTNSAVSEDADPSPDADSAVSDETNPSLDADGVEVDRPEDVVEGVSGSDVLEVSGLGTPLTLSLDDGWIQVRDNPGESIFAHREQSADGSNRLIVFLRPHLLTDPRQPEALGVTPWPLDNIEGWLNEVVDGIIITDPELVKIGGRDSLYFEAEVTDPAVCGEQSFCAGFIANTHKPGPEFGGEGIISGWAFNPGVHDRIWWVGQDDEVPLVIISQTASTDRSFQPTADALFDTLIIGAPQPHPVPFQESGLAN